MNISKRQNSAFYAGATRYGGSAATAKRREATRQHFFDIKEIPSTSRPFDQSYYVQSYKIDSNDIIRRQQAVPQLTTSAKRILNWIEENSTPTNGETPLTKRNKFKSHRFNPMKVIPRRAQVERRYGDIDGQECEKKSIAFPRDTRGPSQEITSAASNQSNCVTLSVTQAPKSTSQAPMSTTQEPRSTTQAPKSTSDRFISPKFSGPLRDIDVQKCEKKSFAPPRDTRKPPQETTKKPIVEHPAPKALEAPPPTAFSPAPTAASPAAPLPPPPPTIAAAPPAAPTKDVETDIDSSKSNAAQAPAPASSVLPPLSNAFSMPAFTPAPARAVTPSPMMSTQSQTPTVMASVPTTPQAALNQSNRVNLSVTQTPKSTSDRFISPKFLGPSRDIDVQECEKKSFAPPRDTRGPPQETTKRPIVEHPAPKALEAYPPTAVSPATASPASPPAAAAPPAAPAGDVEMDIDSSESNAAQAPAPASSVIPPLSNAFSMPAFTSAPAQAVTPSPMMSTQSQTPTVMASVPTTPQAASNQGNLMTPSVNQTPSFFSPPGSLNLPAFTPSTPQTPLPMLSPVTTPTTSNPFAPPPSSGIRNRKILRGARRLHR